MEKAEMKKLAAEVARFIRPTPGCVTCGKEPTQMCGKYFGRIRHKLPLTEEQQTRVRDIAWIFHELFFISLKNSECVQFLGYLQRKTENTICNSSLSALTHMYQGFESYFYEP